MKTSENEPVKNELQRALADLRRIFVYCLAHCGFILLRS